MIATRQPRSAGDVVAELWFPRRGGGDIKGQAGYRFLGGWWFPQVPARRIAAAQGRSGSGPLRAGAAAGLGIEQDVGGPRIVHYFCFTT
ncbi:MAG: hypothetical protein ACYC3X_25845 [Pirellulaceae bacterium]